VWPKERVKRKDNDTISWQRLVITIAAREGGDPSITGSRERKEKTTTLSRGNQFGIKRSSKKGRQVIGRRKDF